jgi:anti-sigma regulatory factor (Ser/Thr protein kinase)
MTSASSEERVYFELVFRPSVILTTVVRRFISDFYERVFACEDSTSRLALATQELLENAIKYGVAGDTVLSIDYDRRTKIVRIRTSNRSDPDHIAILQRRFGEMRAVPDAFKFYQQLLRASMHETVGSGLGLARIRCEGEMDIDLTVTGDLVDISAVAHVAPQGAS